MVDQRVQMRYIFYCYMIAYKLCHIFERLIVAPWIHVSVSGLGQMAGKVEDAVTFQQEDWMANMKVWRARSCRSPHSSSVWPNTAVKGKLKRSKLADRQLDQRTAFLATCSAHEYANYRLFRFTIRGTLILGSFRATKHFISALVLLTCNNQSALCCHPAALVRTRTFWGW